MQYTFKTANGEKTVDSPVELSPTDLDSLAKQLGAMHEAGPSTPAPANTPASFDVEGSGSNTLNLEGQGGAPSQPNPKVERMKKEAMLMAMIGGHVWEQTPWAQAQALVKKPFDKAGEMIAEHGGKFPKTAAAVGTGVAMIPDILMSIPTGGGAAKNAPKGLTAAANMMTRSVEGAQAARVGEGAVPMLKKALEEGKLDDAIELAKKSGAFVDDATRNALELYEQAKSEFTRMGAMQEAIKGGTASATSRPLARLNAKAMDLKRRLESITPNLQPEVPAPSAVQPELSLTGEANPRVPNERMVPEQYKTARKINGKVVPGHQSGPVMKEANRLREMGDKEGARRIIEEDYKRKGLVDSKGNFITGEETEGILGDKLHPQDAAGFAREKPMLVPEKAIKPGTVKEGVIARSTNPELPEQKLIPNGPTMNDTPEALKKMGFSDAEIATAKEPTYHLSQDVPGHPAGSTLPASELKRLGYEIPATPEQLPFKEPANRIELSGRDVADINKETGMNIQGSGKTAEDFGGVLEKPEAGEVKPLFNFTKKGDKLQKQLKETEAKILELTQGAKQKLATQQAEVGEKIGALSNVAKEALPPLEPELAAAIQSGKDTSLLKRSSQNLTFLADDLDRPSNGAFSRYVMEPLMQGEQAFDSEKTRISQLVESFKKMGITKEEDTAFRLFIEGKAAAPVGREKIFTEAKAAYNAATAEGMKEWNEVAPLIGMKPITSSVSPDEYVHHAQNFNALYDLMGGSIREVPENLMFAKATDPVANFIKQRFNGMPESMLMGAVESLEKYKTNIARIKAYGSIGQKFRSMAQLAEGSGKVRLGKQLGGIADDLLGTSSVKQAAATDVATGGLLEPTSKNAVLGLVSKYSQAMVRSASAAIGNLGGAITASIYTGPGRAITGTFEGLFKGSSVAQAIGKAMNPEYQLMYDKYSQVGKLHGFVEPLRFGDKAPNLVERTTDAFFSYMNRAANVGAWNQGLKAALSDGHDLTTSVKIADQVLMRSQAVYRSEFRPAFLRADMGKLLTPMSTYVFNAANALGQDVLFNKMSTIQKAQVLAYMAVTGWATNMETLAIAGKEKVDAGDFVPGLRSLRMGVLSPIAAPVKAMDDLRKGDVVKAAVGMAPVFGVPKQVGDTVKGVMDAPEALKKRGLLSALRGTVFGPPPKRKSKE